ncbi:autotransporter strand-loop-strand O-heptosyltransferase [Deltaproteobacteria bacterium]|nr:autotransporter strand-loop-strand O-heptosyltransferase [Deltaproteobacteria bacterium]
MADDLSLPPSVSSAFGEEPSLSTAAQDYSAEPSPNRAPDLPSDLETAAGAAVVPDPFFIPPPELPTQTGPKGVRYDFNDGARVWLPQGQWHVEIHDGESGNIIFACDADEGWVVSTKKYYVPFVIKIWERGNPEALVDHALDLRGRPVLIKFPVGTLGDLIGWFPYAEKFQKKHGCVLECALGKNLIEIFREQYPELTLNIPQEAVTKEPYASYRVGLFFGGNRDCQPIDFRQVGLHRTAGYILGVDPAEEAPRLKLDLPRRIAQPYVCIATKSSCQAKFWNNGHGWNGVTDYLRSLGYRVLAIDKEATVGMNFTWNHIPHGAEDFTGATLSECIALLAHADFYIGLSSGLSWLAWACKIPVVLISGFSLPLCEFGTPYRVYSTHGCMGCWDDTALAFDHHDFFWCPRHKGTDRQYECTRLITGRQVIGHIDRLMRDRALPARGERTCG